MRRYRYVRIEYCPHFCSLGQVYIRTPPQLLPSIQLSDYRQPVSWCHHYLGRPSEVMYRRTKTLSLPFDVSITFAHTRILPVTPISASSLSPPSSLALPLPLISGPDCADKGI